MAYETSYFCTSFRVAAALEHARESLVNDVASICGADNFTPDDLLRHRVAFDMVNQGVDAWLEKRGAKGGYWLRRPDDLKAAVLLLGQYLTGAANFSHVEPETLAQWYFTHRDKEALERPRKYFDRLRDRIEIFDYDRERAVSASMTKTALRQIAYAYGEAEGFDGVASICPAIRHEAAGLILDSIEKSFSPSIF